MKKIFKSQFYHISILTILLTTGCSYLTDYSTRVLGVRTALDYESDSKVAQDLFRKMLKILEKNIENQEDISFHTETKMIGKDVIQLLTRIRPNIPESRDVFKPYLHYTINYNITNQSLEYEIGVFNNYLYTIQDTIDPYSTSYQEAKPLFMMNITDIFLLASTESSFSYLLKNNEQINGFRNHKNDFLTAQGNSFVPKEHLNPSNNKNTSQHHVYDFQFMVNKTKKPSESLMNFVVVTALNLIKTNNTAYKGLFLLSEKTK